MCITRAATAEGNLEASEGNEVTKARRNECQRVSGNIVSSLSSLSSPRLALHVESHRRAGSSSVVVVVRSPNSLAERVPLFLPFPSRVPSAVGSPPSASLISREPRVLKKNRTYIRTSRHGVGVPKRGKNTEKNNVVPTDPIMKSLYHKM